MLVMLKEISGEEVRDITVNVREVVSVATDPQSGLDEHSVVTMTDGKRINVKGSVQEVSRRLRASKSLLKG